MPKSPFLHPDYRISMSNMVKVLSALAVVQLLSWLIPALPEFKGIPYYLPLHVLLETISIVVSMMVFAVGWNAHGRTVSGNIVLLACVFFSVGVLDFCHTIAYGGMPDFISPNDAEKHLNYWLSARLFASLVLLAVAVRPWGRLASGATRRLIFGLMLGITVAINWLVIYHQTWLPDTFIPGQGLTPFKKNFEYAVIVINLVTAAMLLLRMREPQKFNVVLLFGAACTLAMSEFYFTLYTTMTGSYNVLGHVYKVIAYLFIYRAIVVEVIEEPYKLLELAKEKLLKESEKNLALLRNASDGIHILDREGCVIEASDSFCAMLGYSRYEIIGMNVAKWDAQLAGEELAMTIAGQLAKRSRSQFETRHRRRDGTVFDVEVSGMPLELEGELVLFNSSRDITERKLAEQALHTNEERLKLATSAGGIGIWDWDVVKNVLTWDQSMYSLYGIDRSNFGGAYDAWIACLHPDDKQYADGEIQAALRGEREYAPEFRIIRPDGSVRNIKAAAKTYCDAQGKPQRMVGTNFDITDIRHIEAELRKYKDHLEEEVQLRTADLVLARNEAEAANKAKSVFLANISHELRTPLNAILGFSDLMRRDESLTPGQNQNLAIINRSGEHLLTLINDVLEMAKIEAGRVQLDNKPLDLGALVRDVTEMMEIRAREKGLQLLLDQSSEFPRYIIGDEARLRQILINLVGNAIKFTQQGGVTIRLGSRENSISHLMMEVEDSGPGISEEDQLRLFQPFVQLGKQAGENKGTGLGLAITRQFVQLMGGSITLESRPGKGSLFRVDLPLTQVKESDIVEPQVSEKGEVTGLAPGQPEYRILIVEDQLENQLLLTQLMARIGLPVKVACDGAQGVELFGSWHPDLIWMDRRMPVMDGMEATRIIRSLPGGRDVRIVAVTASAFKEQRDEMIEVGMNDFVRKPYRFSEIYDSLAQQLGVQYTYAKTSEAEAAPVVLTAEMMGVLEPELRRELADALVSLEGERISAVIAKIAPIDLGLHEAVARLADSFNYPAILSALQTRIEAV